METKVGEVPTLIITKTAGHKDLLWVDVTLSIWSSASW